MAVETIISTSFVSETVATETEGATVVERETVTETVLSNIGPRGPIGPRGEVGPAGATHQHVQSNASALWSIQHNLGFRPGVNVTDTAGSEVFGSVQHITNDQLTVTFSAAFAGRANLN